jgi:hypothetical protein
MTAEVTTPNTKLCKTCGRPAANHKSGVFTSKVKGEIRASQGLNHTVRKGCSGQYK